MISTQLIFEEEVYKPVIASFFFLLVIDEGL